VITNDFSLHVATVNGSGSQTANNILTKVFFRMGIPVNAKNIFPSNIAGLPTWYTIRVSKDGYIARKSTTDFLVGFNEQTFAEDVKEVRVGGAILWNSNFLTVKSVPREDLTVYAVPSAKPSA